MKQDLELIRTILLTIEKHEPHTVSELHLLMGEAVRESVLRNHILLMMEKAFLRGIEVSTLSGTDWMNLSITSHGYELLNTIRDEQIWGRTREEAQKVGGLSLEITEELAKGFVRLQIFKDTGINISM